MNKRLLRAVYSALWRLALPFIICKLYWRSRAEPEYKSHICERFGVYRNKDEHQADFHNPRSIWIHAVSLGETRAVEPLVRALLERNLSILLTHMTASGKREGRRLFQVEIERGSLVQRWLPYDLPGATRRFMRRYSPMCGLLIETEAWPNLLHAAQRYGVPIALVSARMSEKSYRRYSRISGLADEIFGSFTKVLAQTEDDARRLKLLGAVEPKVIGNLKFDFVLPAELTKSGAAWRAACSYPIVVIASTREGEEVEFLEAVLGAPTTASGINPVILIVPRHPNRFDSIAHMFAERGVALVRRSNVVGCISKSAHVLAAKFILGDSVGEMPLYYSASSVAIVAGSFRPLGGQNLIEASACGVPVIVGPHTYNFAEATDQALTAGAALQAMSPAEAWNLALELIDCGEKRRGMGKRATAFVDKHRGATSRTILQLSNWLH